MKHKCFCWIPMFCRWRLFRKIWISGLDNRLVFRVSTRSIKIDCDKKVFFCHHVCLLGLSHWLLSLYFGSGCVSVFFMLVLESEGCLMCMYVRERKKERESCLRMLKKEAGWVLPCVCVRMWVTVNACACACVRVEEGERVVCEGSRRSSLNVA